MKSLKKILTTVSLTALVVSSMAGTAYAADKPVKRLADPPLVLGPVIREI